MELKRLIYSTALRLSKIEGDRPRDVKVFGMSEAGECSRVIYMRRLKAEERTYKSKMDEARVRMLLNDGRYHQAAITEYIRQAPGVQITNIEQGVTITRTLTIAGVQHTYAIVGHPDGILSFTKEEKRVVLEVKGLSQFTKGLTKIKDGDIDTFREVYPKAIPQTRILSRAFNTDGGIMLFKNKNTSEFWECFVPRDDAAEERILQKFDRVYTALAANGDIACDYVAGDRGCDFCPFANECGHGK